jgi:uncharacterized membrane protein YraQ (UPF0718 family)
MRKGLQRWAATVKTINDMPDLWAELKRTPQILASIQQGEASNEPFTADEQAEIARRLDEIKQLVRNQFELTAEQFATIGQRLDDAVEASKRLGRKDWAMLFYGAVISTGITDAVPPGVIQTVLSTVFHGIAHIFGIGGPPQVIGP